MILSNNIQKKNKYPFLRSYSKFLGYILRNKKLIVFALIGSGTLIKIIRLLKERAARSILISKDDKKIGSREYRSKKVGVNIRFLEQLRKILPIVIPGIASREATLVVLLTVVLIARTYLDIWFSGFNGTVVRSVVSRDKKLFFQQAILLFGFMMWPMSAVNNLLKWIINTLSLSFRTRLTHYAHEQYLDDMVYYKIANLDNRIQNADQLLTQDIEKFSESLSRLYSDIAKPMVDIVLFVIKLGQAIGVDAPVYMLTYFMLSGIFLRAISPPFGRFIATEQKLDGDFRYNHSRVIAHSEEIAFYGGQIREKEEVNKKYSFIVNHLKKVFKLRFLNGIIDSLFVKYYATMLAYFILSRPVFDSRYKTEKIGIQEQDSTKIMEDYSRNSGYLVNLSQAIGRILLAGRDLTRFTGFTSRVADFFDVLEDVKLGHYERTMITNHVNEKSRMNAESLRGTMIETEGVIEFQSVPIATPNGDILVQSLSFRITSGMNCIITGPNGCGKSSLFRILGNLWPLYGGVLIKPKMKDLFYVPQKPYLSLGNLREQIIYPHLESYKQHDDERIRELLGVVNLEYIIEREGGLDSVRDWHEVLSGGEKQRVAMARLFYHKPSFAILDECTSAVSVDIEGHIYNYARNFGMSLLTVSHRPSLFQYHDYLLKFDGQGGYEFKKMNE